MTYLLPPNDPRYLDATDEEILHDLLVQRFRDEALARAWDPKRAALEDALRDPGMADKLREERRAALADLDKIRRMLASSKRGTKALPATGALRLAGTVQPSRKKVQP